MLEEHKLTPLLEIGDLKVKISLLSILLGGGNIDIFVESPFVSYIEFNKKNNWEIASGDKSKSFESKDNVEPEDMVLPAFLAQSRLNLKVRRLKINYKFKSKSPGIVDLSRFIIKDLNFKGPTAFELDSDFHTELSNKKKISLSTLVIGEFNLAEIIETKKN